MCFSRRPATLFPTIRRRALRIRPNIFLVSSLLLTPAFFWLLPYMVRCVRASDDMTQTAGLASITVIIVALIVIWTWLVAGSRVAWLIMAVIVWVWAFPVMMISRLHIGPVSSSQLKDWVVSAWRQDGLARVSLINPIMFSLMLIGLILPLRALFRIGKLGRDTQIYRDARQDPG